MTDKPYCVGCYWLSSGYSSYSQLKSAVASQGGNVSDWDSRPLERWRFCEDCWERFSAGQRDSQMTNEFS